MSALSRLTPSCNGSRWYFAAFVSSFISLSTWKARLENGYVYLQWNRKYQKTDDATPTGPDVGSSKEVMRRAKEQFSDIERFSRPRGCAFHRVPCFEREGNWTWYDIPTMGGGNF